MLGGALISSALVIYDKRFDLSSATIVMAHRSDEFFIFHKCIWVKFNFGRHIAKSCVHRVDRSVDVISWPCCRLLALKKDLCMGGKDEEVRSGVGVHKHKPFIGLTLSLAFNHTGSSICK